MVCDNPLNRSTELTTQSPLDFVVSAQSNEKGARGLYSINKCASPLIPLLRGTTICPPLAGAQGVDAGG